MSDYPDLDGRLFNLFLLAVLSEVSNFAATQTCFVIVTLLAFFLRKTVLSLSFGLLVLGLVLYPAGYDNVSILVVSATLLLHVG